MQRTNTDDPNYFHKVVDCQWACPAHTNVPEYIRLIAQGQYTEAYMVNRESNVFPGILGRTCDRPCEPACRRGRVDGKPVAICRLKRVAADLKGEISHLLPKIPTKKNGKRVACVGAGPASLAVANDLMPLGYEVVMFEKFAKPGGLTRTNIPVVPACREKFSTARSTRFSTWAWTSATTRPWRACAICWARASMRFSWGAARRAARTWRFPGATIRIVFTWASIGWSRSRSAIRTRSAKKF